MESDHQGHADPFKQLQAQVIACMAQIAQLQASDKKVKGQVLHPLYKRHLLDLAKSKLREIGNQPPAVRPPSKPAPPWAIDLAPSVNLTRGDVHMVWGSDKDNQREVADAAAHSNITIDDQEEAARLVRNDGAS